MSQDALREKGRSSLAVEFDLLRYRPLDWFLLRGSRLVVSGLLLVVVAAILWGVVLSGAAPLEERTPTLFLLFALISGNFTLITIVVSISQFVLSRHLESPGEIREQMREVTGYRQEVSEVTEESVVPVTQAGFLRLLFSSIDRDVKVLQNSGWTPEEVEMRREVQQLVTDLDEHVTEVIDLVEGGDVDVRLALFALLDTNYSRYVYGAYRLRAAYGSDLPEPVADRLNRLERHVEQVDVARRYFKTVFIQSELASLSRLLLYIGIPVLTATVVLTLLFTATESPYVSRPVLAIAIPLVVTVGFAPIVLLTAYIVRLATVVQRTAAMYPFTTRYGT